MGAKVAIVSAVVSGVATVPKTIFGAYPVSVSDVVDGVAVLLSLAETVGAYVVRDNDAVDGVTVMLLAAAGRTPMVAEAHHLLLPLTVNVPGFSLVAAACLYADAIDVADPPDDAPLH